MTRPALNSPLAQFCLLKFDQLFARIAELDDAQVNERPALDGANSPYAIGFHCLGMMRRWSSTVNLGVTVPRDRDAEFTASGTVGELLELAGATRAAFVDDMHATDLDAPPAAPLADRDAFWQTNCEGVLLHVLEELSQHLGHVDVTIDAIRTPR